MSTVIEQYYDKLFNLMLSPSGKIQVSNNFRGQMKQINTLLSNDVTGLVSTILEYMVKTGTVPIYFNSKNAKLEKLFNIWKDSINLDINSDIPSGLRGFTEQYLRERWRSSFIAVVIKWEKLNNFMMPTKMYIVDGASIYVENKKKTLNGNKYYLGKPGKEGTIALENNENQTVIIRKPYNQWYNKYPVPYLVRKGTLYHALFKSKILERQADIIETAFPYQMLIKVGTQEAIRKGYGPTQAELDKIKEEFQNKKKEFDEHVLAKGLVGAFAGDVSLEELMPDYIKALDPKIRKSTDQDILSSLGMIELKGFSSTREEAILNPKVLVEEVEDAVKDYVELLTEVVKQIKIKNSTRYTINDKVEVQAGVITSFLTAEMKTLIRSWYDRGLVGDKSGLENTTGLNFQTQVRERETEKKDGLDKTMYPRIIQNMEKDPADLSPDDENVPDDKKKGTPESKNFKNASESIICSYCQEIVNYNDTPEAGMGYIKCPNCNKSIDQNGKCYNACDETECIVEPMKSIRGIPNEIRKALDNDSQRIFKVAFNEGFKKSTELEYDNFLREKASMTYAWQETKKYLKSSKKSKKDKSKLSFLIQKAVEEEKENLNA